MTSRRRPSNAPRGSTLLLAMVLLLVLSIIGVAAVSLGSGERASAGVKTHRDKMLACAQAAQAHIWAEILRHGQGYLLSSTAVPDLRLPDGTVLRAGHYRETTGLIAKTTVRAVRCKTPGERERFIDLTNRDAFFDEAGSCFQGFARCVDPRDREPIELEIEFLFNKIF
jgi:hypothetical protein